MNFSLTPTSSKITFCEVITFYCYHEVLNALFHVPLYQKGIEPVHKALLLCGNLNVIDNKSNKEFTIHNGRIRTSHCVKSVRILSYSGPYLSIFSPNAGKCGPE